MIIDDRRGLPVKNKHLTHYGDCDKDKWIWDDGSRKYFVKRASGLYCKSDEGRVHLNISFKPEDYGEKTDDPKKQYNLAVEDALMHAKFNQQLVKDGVYPQGSQFVVCDDGRGNPTLMAIMEYGDCRFQHFFNRTDMSFSDSNKHVSSMLNKKRGEILNLFRNKYGFRPNRDVTINSNYALFNYVEGDPQVHLFDLHIFEGDEITPGSMLRMPDHLVKRLVSTGIIE